MNDVIEAAAKVLFEDSGRKWDDAEEWERNMERATAAVLHKAGMLATREELGIETFDELHTIDNRDLWEKVAAGEHPESKALRRYVTEWFGCDENAL